VESNSESASVAGGKVVGLRGAVEEETTRGGEGG
jgi:hypothetical protein